jgi:hypothetical protein
MKLFKRSSQQEEKPKIEVLGDGSRRYPVPEKVVPPKIVPPRPDDIPRNAVAELAQLRARIAELESEAILHARAFDGAMNKYYELKAEREWQPIETAPEDGTHILIVAGGKVHEAWYFKNVYSEGVFGYEGVEYYGTIMSITSWMPLPKPPEVKK